MKNEEKIRVLVKTCSCNTQVYGLTLVKESIWKYQSFFIDLLSCIIFLLV